MVVKVESAGFLPLVRTMELPRLNRVSGKEEKPPAEVPVEFQFDTGVQRQSQCVLEADRCLGRRLTWNG